MQGKHFFYKKYICFIILFFIFLAGISSSPWPDDQDGVNFLFGIERYDIAFHRPHFPGYPIYIFFTKLINYFCPSPEIACIIFSIFSGSLCLILTAILSNHYFNQKTAIISTFTLAFHPVFFEFSHKIFTEIPAMALILFTFYILAKTNNISKWRWIMAGLLIGITIGIRLSWWPYTLSIIFFGWCFNKTPLVILGLITGILLWLLPQLIVVGFFEFFSIGFTFTGGHFSQWGGALRWNDGVGERLLSIIMRMFEVFGWYGTGVFYTRIPWIIFTTFCLFKIFSTRKYPAKGAINFFFTASLFYFLWISLGQNVEKTRHFIPLIPMFIFLISPIVMQYPKLAAIVVTIFSLTLPFNYFGRKNSLNPVVKFKEWISVTKAYDTAFYCGTSERFFDRYPPPNRIINVVSMDTLDFTIKSTWPKPKKIFICDDIPGLNTTKSPKEIFLTRKGDPVDITLKIYDW